MPYEKVLYNATLVFPVIDEKILLALKTKKIGAGFLNGYGGGIEEDETCEECASRELLEESGLVVSQENLTMIAVVDFHNTKTDGETFICRVYVYLAFGCTGTVKETDEMIEPSLYDMKNLPVERMMPADRVWLPAALQKKIYAFARLGPFQKKLLSDVEITYVDSFDEYL